MNNMKKRFIALLLSFSMVLGLLPQFTIDVFASGSVLYEPVTTDYAILNQYNYQNKNYYTYYVKSTRLYNAVSKFSGLSAGTTYTNHSKVYSWNNFVMNGSSQTGYGRLASANQLEVNLSATIHNVKHRHGNIFRYADSLAYQYAYIRSGGQEQIVNGYDFSTSGTATQRLGDMEFGHVDNYDTIKLGIGTGHTFIDCHDGDCSIGDIAVAFADITNPKVKSVYTCDANGNANSRVKAGAPVYLKVEFNEPIRFSDNNASDHSGITAKMQDSNANTLTGSLVALKDEYLMFEFDNTSVSGFTSTNITMTSVDLSALFGSGNGSWSLSQVQKGASINSNIDTAAFKGAGFTTSDSLVTDIAGNPLRKPSSNSSAALTSACYVDGEAPYVANIIKTAQMNNGDIKEALGKTDTSANSYLDASDTTAGVGDKIIYTANFNEKLNINGNNYNSNYFIGMMATLNVKSSDGSYVKVRSATMSQISGGTDLKNGASQGSITSVTFSPFTLTNGMTCDDPNGNIKITEIAPYIDSVLITDLCGNTYADSGNSWSTLNTNPYIMDMTAPTVTTTAGQSGSSYSPTTVTTSGAAITEFYFPISITDATGTDGIKGSISWINGVSGAKEFRYEYAVTASTTEPDSSVWKLGTTGQAHSFTQVSAGNYIHIRLLDGELYNLHSSSLSITAMDYAGNRGATSVALDYVADCVAPAASIASTGKSYDNGTGTFNANALVKDYGGLDSVYYLWVTDGSGAPEKDAPAWKLTGSFTKGATSVTVEADYAGISGAFTGELYIKAVDLSGNVSVNTLGSYTYDISAPVHTLTYTEEPRAQASLNISGLEPGNAAVVMVKKPGSTDDTYYVSVVDSADHLGDVLNNTSIGVQLISDLYSWQTYTVTTTTSGAFSFTFQSAPDSMLNNILNGNYYGEVEVTVLTGKQSRATGSFYWPMEDIGKPETYVNDDAFNYKIARVPPNNAIRSSIIQAGTGSYPVYAEKITLKSAPGKSLVYGANITTSDILNHWANKTQGYPLTATGFDPDNSSDDMLSTLEGVTFNISLTNNIVSQWGISDIDFSKTYISIIRTNDENSKYDGKQVGDKIYLAPQATQSITLPAYNYPSGAYMIALTVTSKASGQTYTFDTFGSIYIYVDATEASQDFGFAGYYYNVQDAYYGLTSKDNYTYYGPVYGAKDADGKVFTQYTAGNGTVYVPVNSSVGSDGYLPRLYFTANDAAVDSQNAHYGVKAIKAWNVTSGVDAEQSKAKSVWYSAKDATNDFSSQYSYYFPKYVDNASDVLSSYGTISNTAFGDLPLIKNTINTVAFQVVNANGNASEVRYVYIYPMDTPVSGTVSKSEPGHYVKEGTLTFKPAEGQSMDGVSVYAYDFETSTLNDITGNYDLSTNSYSLALTEPGQHFYYVYTLDTYGNYTFFTKPDASGNDDSYWGLTDAGAPTVVSSSCTDMFEGKFSASYVFNEETIWNDMDQKLNLYFDSQYMNALGVTSSSSGGKGFTVNLPVKSGKQTVFMASKSNPYGIYKVDLEPVTNQGKQIKVTVYGVVKYDASVAEGENVQHTLFATLEDPLGNVSDPATGGVEVKVRNTMPKYTNGSYNVYSTGGGSTSYRGLTAVFNTPVVVDKSIGTNAPSAYSETKTSELPIFGDGTYDISFYDIFGTKWTQQITLTDVFKGYSLRVSLSDSDYTSGPETVTITADHPDTTKFTVIDSTNGTWKALTGVNINSATFDVSDNKEMHIVLNNSNDGNNRVDEMFYITNIITGAPKATVQWYYSEFMSDTPPTGVTSTTKAVTASYTTTDEVTPSGGTASSYTFYPGDTKNSYTFEYTDKAGNKGGVTATLPIALNTPAQPVIDTTAPEYSININGMADGLYYPAGYYSSTTSTDTLSNAISAVGYVQGYSFNIDVTEDSAYKFILLSGANADTSGISYASSASDTVSGVTLTGRTVTVTKAADFTVVIVDKSNNKNTFSMNLDTYFDNTQPTAVVKKDYKSFYDVRTYIKLSDTSNAGADTGKVTLLSPMGLPTETDSASPYYGQYYYDFADNKSLTLTFRDGAGNKSSTTVKIDSLDMSMPTSSVVWSPYYYDSDSSAGADPSVPPSHMTNRDVTATVNYSKSINTISQSISINGGSDWTQVVDNTYDNRFTLKKTSNTATVTFHKGGFAIKLTATALNGKTVSNTLSLGDVIDKAGPTVNQKVSYNYNTGFETGIPYSATIMLTPTDKDVYCDNATSGKLKDSSISFTVYDKGDYTYHFTDSAGNTSALTVSVDKVMDRTPPDISINTGDGTITNGNVTASVSIDEDGTIAVTGANKASVFSGAVTKNTAKQLNIANNGSYQVSAYDKAGNKTRSTFIIGSIDKIAPSVTLDPLTVSVRQDSSANELKAILNAGCTVSDNVSGHSALYFTYDATSVKLAAPGVYKITYTAQDEAGNTATATRFVRVYSKDELDVLLNSKKTTSGGTTTLTSKTITISVENPLGAEPYTIYLSRGIRAEGQMKKDYTIIKPDATGNFAVSSTGFYTLYIVTQSRQTYLTKIYIDQ